MELQIVKFFNRFGKDKIDLATRIISYIPLLTVFWGLMALALLFFDRANGLKILVALALATIFHFAITEGIFKILLAKNFTRVRPYVAFPDEIKPLGKKHRDSSFPSSHMSSTLAMLTVATLFVPVIWPAALLFTLFMAYARLHNGMHYPSDIIAGTVLGIVYGTLAVYLVR
ncbi:MAG: phosphatase PAP2 family protein [Parcubacteria group bacterium]|jgi:undecaprenyl-diphosphatase